VEILNSLIQMNGRRLLGNLKVAGRMKLCTEKLLRQCLDYSCEGVPRDIESDESYWKIDHTEGCFGCICNVSFIKY
jgi:hypothetical protein